MVSGEEGHVTEPVEKARYLLAWFDGRRQIDDATLVPIRRQIEDIVNEPRDEVEVDIWLESPGGDAHSAFKLALMLRHVAGHIRVVVPDYAKSAATLLALVGHEIFLAPGAELGPLDAQMLEEEGSLSGRISALNIAHAADEVAKDAVDLAVTGGADVMFVTGLGRAQTIDAMLSFSARFSEPLVRQLDPKLVHHAKQLLVVTARYAARLLAETAKGDPDEIANKLVEDFPTHGYVIAYQDALQLGLPVKPIGEYDLLDAARKLHRMSEDGARLVRFCPMDDVLDKFAEQSSDEQEGTEHGDEGERGNEDQHSESHASGKNGRAKAGVGSSTEQGEPRP